MAGHLLAACLQYGQVLASAVSRLVSAAAAALLLPHFSPLLFSHLSLPPPPDRCSHTTTTTSQLFMGPACFDFKYLPRRCSFCLGKTGVGLQPDTPTRHTSPTCVDIYTFVHLQSCIHTPVRAEAEGRSALFSSHQIKSSKQTAQREKENSSSTDMWP